MSALEPSTEYPEETLAREYRNQKLAFAQAKAIYDAAGKELLRVGECVKEAKDRLAYHCLTCPARCEACPECCEN